MDLLTGAGLAEALRGVDAVIDVANMPETEPGAAVEYFRRTSGVWLAAGAQAGLRQHVLLSIVEVDAVDDNGHYLGKVAQERR